MKKNKRKEIINFLEKYKINILLIFVLIIQTIIFLIVGYNKSYIHMDEAYSLGLASYNKTEIQNNEDFYNHWHNKEYYENYITVNDNEVDNYEQVYNNQKNDVHPPLYYFILRFAMSFHLNSYTKWTGIIVNIVIYCFITIFMYFILKKLLKDKNDYKIKALFIAFVSSLTLSSLTNVIYIRMYALSTLNIVITTYLHLKLLDSNQCNYKLLFGIGIMALIGSLTHYHYLFYLAMLFVMFVIKYKEEKRYKELIAYIVTICIAGMSSLIIFPYSIQHMFFGYRGQGSISNLLDISRFKKSINQYILKINEYAFNKLLYIIIIAILGIIVYKKRNHIILIEKKNKYVKYIVLPTIFYFILVAISSPWVELRYVLPICEMIFVCIMFVFEQLLENLIKEEKINKIILGICLIIFIVPLLSNLILKIIPIQNFRLEPEVMYSDKKEIVEKLQNEFNVPTIYMFNSNNNRFLDDILLFSIIKESYIAKDLEYNDDNIRNIVEGKNINNGIIIFINEGQDNAQILNIVQDTLELKEIKHLKRLNACDVYYIK